ncbi:MAG: hypothetical protein H6739_14120 [Alphaproteobacteria bacterium]|nr:hypothetical protein [Alphaproteobacteria bacterium]
MSQTPAAKRLVRLSWLGFIVFNVALIGGVAMLFERVEEDVTGEPGARARANPLLALERFYSAMGTPTRSAPEIRVPAAAEGQLVLLMPPGQRLSPDQADLVLDWAARGGSLVVSLPQSQSDDPDPLYRKLGVRNVRLQPPPAAEETPEDADEEGLTEEQSAAQDPPEDEPDEDEAAPEEPEEEPWALEESWAPRPVTVNGVTYALELSPRLWTRQHGNVTSDWNTFGGDPEHPERWTYAWRPWGEGDVGVLSSWRFLSNDNIQDARHAAFAWEVLAERGFYDGITVIYRGESESMWQRAWTLAWPALIALIGWALAWAWGASARFGPLVPAPSVERRSLLEHVEAAGDFLWRKGHHGVLLESLRAEVLERLGARTGGGRIDPSAPDAVARVAAAGRVGEDIAALALSEPESRDRRAFTAAVRALLDIRRTR